MKCPCGAVYISEDQFAKHYASAMHVQQMNPQNVYSNCFICRNYSYVDRYISCKRCEQAVCRSCYEKIKSSNKPKCPYCRKLYK